LCHLIVFVQFESSRALNPPILPTSDFLLSPSLSHVGLLCFAKKVALAFADESSDSSWHCSPPPRHYGGKMFSYLNLSAFEFEDLWIKCVEFHTFIVIVFSKFAHELSTFTIVWYTNQTLSVIYLTLYLLSLIIHLQH
jgi:hypothetical protein